MWDPRPSAEAASTPIRGAVNIALDELPLRRHEMPPPRSELLLPEGLRESGAAVDWLVANGFPPPEFVPWHKGSVGLKRLWEPNPLLERAVANLPPGRALDLGCGSGRDATFLASLGWFVLGVDHLPDALDRARDLARRYLVGPSPHWVLADARAAPLRPGGFDLVVAVRMFVPAIADIAARRLRPRGSVLFEAFVGEARIRHHTWTPALVEERFADFTIVEMERDESRGRPVVRVLATRP